MSLRVLWFVVAGFILGFATSTLWEWLYYRGKRKAQFLQAARPILPTTRLTPSHVEPESRIEQPQETWAQSYRSPGIYLESEHPQLQPAETGGGIEKPSPFVFTEPMDQTAAPDTTIVPPSTHTAPRINPATLALLQSTVAKTPIAQPEMVKSVNPETPVTSRADPVTVSSVSVAAKPVTQSFVQQETLTEDPGAEGEEAKIDISAPVSSSTLSVEPNRAQAIEAAIVEQSVPKPHSAVKSARVLSPKTPALTDHPDDLALIKGVGEAYKRRLYNAGVYTWRQVAESDIETLRRITRVKPNANIGGWRQQAQELAEKYQRWDTTFQGPLDDFTRIDGIGAITADILYKAGLCTYEQLTDTSPDELAKIVPAPTVGNEIDFEGWISAAMRLANTKRRNQELLP